MRILVTGLVVTAICSSTAHATSSSAWSERGVFVYGRLALDCQKGWAGFYPPIGHRRLKDCSTESLLCADTLLFSLVLPRRCPAAVEKGWARFSPGQTWSVGANTTRILREETTPLAAGMGRMPSTRPFYLLATDGKPYTVAVYAPSVGVTQIFFDSLTELDLSAIARQEGIEGLMKREWAASPGRYLSPLITQDAFGQCQEARPEGAPSP